MTLVPEIIENAAVGIGVLEDIKDFGILRKPGVAATIWRRQLPAEFLRWLDNLPPEHLPSARIVVRSDIVRDAINTICTSFGMPDDLNRSYLVDDSVMLSEQFAELMQSEFVRIRFDVIQDDACRKFHIDAVTARLVCTYRGLGTQYGISVDGNEPKRIFTVPTGAPMMLKGTKWPEPPASGLLHRSPPIEGSGMTRLVLVIDPIIDEVGVG